MGNSAIQFATLAEKRHAIERQDFGTTILANVDWRNTGGENTATSDATRDYNSTDSLHALEGNQISLRQVEELEKRAYKLLTGCHMEIEKLQKQYERASMELAQIKGSDAWKRAILEYKAICKTNDLPSAPLLQFMNKTKRLCGVMNRTLQEIAVMEHRYELYQHIVDDVNKHDAEIQETDRLQAYIQQAKIMCQGNGQNEGNEKIVQGLNELTNVLRSGISQKGSTLQTLGDTITDVSETNNEEYRESHSLLRSNFKLFGEFLTDREALEHDTIDNINNDEDSNQTNTPNDTQLQMLLGKMPSLTKKAPLSRTGDFGDADSVRRRQDKPYNAETRGVFDDEEDEEGLQVAVCIE